MSTNINTYGDISPRTAGKAVARLLKRGQHLLVTERFGQMDPQEKNATKTRKYRRYHSLPRAVAPLAEGVTPKGQKLRYTDYTATLEQFGDLVELSDVVEDTHEDPVLQEAMDLCGEQAAETIEAIRITHLKAGTTVFYANGVTARTSVTSPPLRADFRKMYRFLMNNKARMVSKIVPPSIKISTKGIEPGFFCLGHTDLKADLRDMPGFTPVVEYGNPGNALPGEVGSIEEFRFILSPMFEPWLSGGASSAMYLAGGVAPSAAASCDVYPMLVVAADAYAIVPLQGFKNVDIGVQNPGKKTKSDPLGQRGFASWKTWQTCCILNQLWLLRYEVAATATPA